MLLAYPTKTAKKLFLRVVIIDHSFFIQKIHVSNMYFSQKHSKYKASSTFPVPSY